MEGSHLGDAARLVLLDTDVFSRLLVPASARAAATPEAIESRRAWTITLTGRSFVISAQTRAELLAWPLMGGWTAKRTEQLHTQISALGVAPLDDLVQDHYAQLTAWAKRSGHGLGDRAHSADRWHAACARAFDLDFASDDGIFDDVPDLRLLRRRP